MFKTPMMHFYLQRVVTYLKVGVHTLSQQYTY